MYFEPGKYYWVKSTITENRDVWEIAFVDKDYRFWIFGVAGWFPRSEILEFGPEIKRPDEP